jgi:hypothetical protein
MIRRASNGHFIQQMFHSEEAVVLSRSDWRPLYVDLMTWARSQYEFGVFYAGSLFDALGEHERLSACVSSFQFGRAQKLSAMQG